MTRPQDWDSLTHTSDEAQILAFHRYYRRVFVRMFVVFGLGYLLGVTTVLFSL